MKKNENTVKVHEPFSPTIVETQVPKKFIDIINSVGDEVRKIYGPARFDKDSANTFRTNPWV